MLKRLIALPKNQHILLFGARGVGKSTWLKHCFDDTHSVWINLLKASDEDRFSRNPDELAKIARAMRATGLGVNFALGASPLAGTTRTDKIFLVIDEIQKLPKLLDIVHQLIEEKLPIFFIMTGSSARKLKRGGANLLAGRAFVYHLFPFSFVELAEQFDLQRVLEWGALPRIFECKTTLEKRKFLQAYASTYLKEGIWAEHLIRNLDPFRRFLEVAAQMNGKMINLSSIARDVGVSDQTVKEYFSILEDTLIGFILKPFHHSFRKRLNSKPKFYFFDTGVTRALANLLQLPLQEGTSAYGEAFEHFIILECIKLASYHELDYRFSYLNTQNGAEVDLIVERPGKPPLFIEIKSSTNVTEAALRTLTQLAQDFVTCKALCFSRDPYPKQYDQVTVYPWQEGILKYFSSESTSEVNERSST